MGILRNRLILIAIIICLACVAALAGCTVMSDGVYVTGIEQTRSQGLTDFYTVYYSDGSTTTFTVNNGTDGADGADLTVEDVFERYVEEYGDISYSDFLKQFISVGSDTSLSVAQSLRSTMKIYAEFVETTTVFRPPHISSSSDTAIYTGSAVIWAIEGESVYIVTNYHVVFDSSADAAKNGNSQIARKIYGYLYGSEEEPKSTGAKDGDGYTEYDYGGYAVECEYIGGSIVYDIALLKADKADLLAINEDIQAVALADDYYVGQTAYTVGNPEGNGLSVTQGIVCVDNEYIAMSLDGTTRYYRSIRIDTALYGGNSGGGLFNSQGRLIGICNAGDTLNENINYAIPVQIVKAAVENILYYHGLVGGKVGVYTVNIGISTASQNSRYVYDAQTGYGKITEDVSIVGIASDSVAEKLDVSVGDTVVSIVINGEVYEITRSFVIDDIALAAKSGDEIGLILLRDGEEIVTQTYVIQNSDLSLV